MFLNDFIFISKYIFSLALFYTSEQQVTLTDHVNAYEERNSLSTLCAVARMRVALAGCESALNK